MINLRKEVCVFLQCYSIFVIEDIFFFLVHCPNIPCVVCFATLLIPVLRIRVSHFIFQRTEEVMVGYIRFMKFLFFNCRGSRSCSSSSFPSRSTSHNSIFGH